MKFPNLLALYLVKLYQYAISPFLVPSCRFYPSCSSYAITILRFDNIILAIIKILLRVSSCNPICNGGFSPPYIHLSQNEFDKRIVSFYSRSNIFAKPCNQYPQKITYFFVNSNSHLLKLKKFYIISIHL